MIDVKAEYQESVDKIPMVEEETVLTRTILRKAVDGMEILKATQKLQNEAGKTVMEEDAETTVTATMAVAVDGSTIPASTQKQPRKDGKTVTEVIQTTAMITMTTMRDKAEGMFMEAGLATAKDIPGHHAGVGKAAVEATNTKEKITMTAMMARAVGGMATMRAIPKLHKGVGKTGAEAIAVTIAVKEDMVVEAGSETRMGMPK